MNCRSVADRRGDVRQMTHDLPADIDLVVCAGRSTQDGSPTDRGAVSAPSPIEHGSDFCEVAAVR